MLNRAYGRLFPLLFVAGALALAFAASAQDEPDGQDSFAEAVAGLELAEGFIDIYSSAAKGKVLARLPSADPDGDQPGVLLRFIHAQRLTAGLGSNPLGLDRGWGNSGRLIRFRRIGERVVAEVENHRYRADTANALERHAVATSFATSFVWSTGIIAEDENGHVLIDL